MVVFERFLPARMVMLRAGIWIHRGQIYTKSKRLLLLHASRRSMIDAAGGRRLGHGTVLCPDPVPYGVKMNCPRPYPRREPIHNKLSQNMLPPRLNSFISQNNTGPFLFLKVFVFPIKMSPVRINRNMLQTIAVT